MIKSLSRIFPNSIIRLITQQSGLRKIILNVGWLFVDNVAAVASGFLVGAWVARYLEPARYGAYNYALAIVALFTPLVALGLKDIVVRDIVRAPEDKDVILGTTFGLQFVGGVVALGIVIGIAQITRPDDAYARWLIAVLASQFIFQAFSITLGYWFNSQVQAKYIVWANNIGLVFYTIVRIVLILSKAPLISFAWVSLGQVIVYAVAMVIFYRLSGQTPLAWRVNFSRAKRLLGNSWPLLVSGLAIMVYLRVGQVMLGNMVDEKTLGHYSAAIRLSEFWFFIPVAISSSVFPSIIRSQENDDDKVYQQRMQLFYDVMTGIAYSIVIPLAFFAPLLIKILYGQDYITAGPILRIHALSLLFVFLGTARSRWLIAEDLVRFNMLVTVLGALTNIAMNFVLIPRFGGLGAAWAVLISQMVSTYLTSILSKRLWPVFGQQSLSLLVPFRLFALMRSLNEILVKTQSGLDEKI